MDGVGLIKDVLSNDDLLRLSLYFKHHQKLNSMSVDEFGRKLLPDTEEPLLKEFSELLLPKVREFFGSQTLLSSYSLFAEYSAETISLHKHKDANACTYTLDLTIYQDKPWAIFIDGQEFLAETNEAVMFMGERYEHWRDTVYDNNDRIGVIFFHYVEPDHWFFTKGPEHIHETWKSMRSK
jgi:hypothetical protein